MAIPFVISAALSSGAAFAASKIGKHVIQKYDVQLDPRVIKALQFFNVDLSPKSNLGKIQITYLTGLNREQRSACYDTRCPEDVDAMLLHIKYLNANGFEFNMVPLENDDN